MTSIDTVDSDIDEAERAIKELEGFISDNQTSIERYRQMPESTITEEYIGDLMRSNFRYQDEIDKLKHRKYELWNYRFHHGQWWKCPYCETSNPPSRNTCQNCI